jgi:hypothetical protein
LQQRVGVDPGRGEMWAAAFAIAGACTGITIVIAAAARKREIAYAIE